MANPLLPTLRNLFLERPARKRDYAYFAGRLEASGKELEARFAVAADSPENRRQLRHIVGLERWGQRRLRTALGEPPIQDEMDQYAPPPRPEPPRPAGGLRRHPPRDGGAGTAA